MKEIYQFVSLYKAVDNLTSYTLQQFDWSITEKAIRDMYAQYTIYQLAQEYRKIFGKPTDSFEINQNVEGFLIKFSLTDKVLCPESR